MSDEKWQLVLENTHESVRTFARAEFAALSGKAIHRLQRIHASGIYGDDYVHKSLWDEYCHEAQEGPYDLLEQAWDRTIESVMEDVIGRISREVAVLLSIFAAWDLDEEDEVYVIGSVWPEGLKRVLHIRIAELAGQRDLDHLGPWRNC